MYVYIYNYKFYIYVVLFIRIYLNTVMFGIIFIAKSSVIR